MANNTDYTRLLDGYALLAIRSYLQSNYQPLDADLTAIAALTGTSGFLKKTSANTWSLDTNSYALSNHTHATSIASSSGTNQISLAYGTKYAITAGGTSYIFTMPSLGTSATTAAAGNHKHTFSSITSRGEAWLEWGGKNFSGSYGCIDAAMVPELGSNRLAFMPAAGVQIAYSRDGGSTWTDYGATDANKINLFNGVGASFTIGKATSGSTSTVATNQYQLKVSIFTSAASVYTVLNKFVIYLSTSGTSANWLTIRCRTQQNYEDNVDTWVVRADKVPVSGWSGYNVINITGTTTYGNTKSSQYGQWEFIFGCDTGSTDSRYPGLTITKIFGFGGVGWTTPSTMAKTGHMYTYDASKNTFFPAEVYASGSKILAKQEWVTSNFAGINHNHDSTYLKLSGGTMTGNLKLKANQYNREGALDCQNSDIMGVNSIYTADMADNTAEGIRFYRDSTHYDSVVSSNGVLYYMPNDVAAGTAFSSANIIVHSGNVSTYAATPLHTHAISLTQTGTATVNLSANTTYTLTAGGQSVVFKTPNWPTVPEADSDLENDSYVSFAIQQQLTSNQKSTARANIGAGTGEPVEIVDLTTL